MEVARAVSFTHFTQAHIVSAHFVRARALVEQRAHALPML